MLRGPRELFRSLLAAVVCLGAAVAANAQEEGPGLRQRLEENGLVAGAAMVTEGFTDGRGAAALGNFTARLELDLRRLRILRGRVFTSVLTLHGNGLKDAIQCPSNLQAAPYRQWGEIWYADTYAGGKARIRAGRQYADQDFGAVDTAADFLNAAFGALPNAPIPTYPAPELGVAAWVAPSSAVSMGGGAYHGGFTVAETKAQVSPRDTVAAGGWKQRSTRGVYATVEHRFPTDDESTRAIFARWGRARNDLPSYAAAGFVFGNAGLGITTVRAVGKSREVVCEIFYKRRVGGKVSIQPDAQYIAPHRWVGGIRLTLEL